MQASPHNYEVIMRDRLVNIMVLSIMIQDINHIFKDAPYLTVYIEKTNFGIQLLKSY